MEGLYVSFIQLSNTASLFMFAKPQMHRPTDRFRNIELRRSQSELAACTGFPSPAAIRPVFVGGDMAGENLVGIVKVVSEVTKDFSGQIHGRGCRATEVTIPAIATGCRPTWNRPRMTPDRATVATLAAEGYTLIP